MRRNIMLWVGCLMLAILLFVIFVGPYLPFIDVTPVPSRLSDSGKLTLPPYKYSAENPLGSDKFGVDNLSRIVVGAKETLLLAGSIALLRYVIGFPLGVMARNKKGGAHNLISILNHVFSFFPTLIAAAAFMSLPLLVQVHLRTFWIVLFLAFIEVGRVAVLVQQQTSRISQELYIEAGNALGLSPLRMAKNHYLPAMTPELIVNLCLDFGKSVLLIGQLGVLHIFIAQRYSSFAGMLNTSNDWGSMLAAHISEIFVSKFQYVLIPSTAILFAILTFNVLGEGLRHLFNRRPSSGRVI
ncbi:ABC transporter permease [Paenibacillus physcomitrellae]|uniref:Peptide ABC transporter permease n=1 Tax=Paenibacillus physcomitrellae TaxID=1619311 RepID=A0ABQ1FQ90_9BACL|nr:ABC transporter permease subunit [Paenibacillus physcomitrellae]GGA26286.1 peptide ABC transporter permease [Paenibacillus physcomitrellae]